MHGYQLYWQKCHSLNFACWLQSQLLGSNAKTRPIDWKIFDYPSCWQLCWYFFFIFPAVHTSATRSVGKTRLGYHWLGRRASSGACQMKVLRNRDNQRTLQGKGSGQFDRLSALFVFNLYCILFIDCIIFLSSLTPINCVSDKPGASLYWSRSQLIGSPEFVPTTPAQALC